MFACLLASCCGVGGGGLGRRPEVKSGSTPTFFAVATICLLLVIRILMLMAITNNG